MDQLGRPAPSLPNSSTAYLLSARRLFYGVDAPSEPCRARLAVAGDGHRRQTRTRVVPWIRPQGSNLVALALRESSTELFDQTPTALAAKSNPTDWNYSAVIHSAPTTLAHLYKGRPEHRLELTPPPPICKYTLEGSNGPGEVFFPNSGRPIRLCFREEADVVRPPPPPKFLQ